MSSFSEGQPAERRLSSCVNILLQQVAHARPCKQISETPLLCCPTAHFYSALLSKGPIVPILILPNVPSGTLS
jgi:hypothetical protein